VRTEIFDSFLVRDKVIVHVDFEKQSSKVKKQTLLMDTIYTEYKLCLSYSSRGRGME
jgi:hypothetical protein